MSIPRPLDEAAQRGEPQKENKTPGAGRITPRREFPASEFFRRPRYGIAKFVGARHPTRSWPATAPLPPSELQHALTSGRRDRRIRSPFRSESPRTVIARRRPTLFHEPNNRRSPRRNIAIFFQCRNDDDTIPIGCENASCVRVPIIHASVIKVNAFLQDHTSQVKVYVLCCSKQHNRLHWIPPLIAAVRHLSFLGS